MTAFVSWMGFTTWVDRITDESNQWLSASKAEEAKDYQAAAVLYLKDASACLVRNSPVRAALSCYCAADCLSKSGASPQATWLYTEAGRLYSSIADHGVSGSIREALWALQRAYACYTLAGNAEEVRRALDSYGFLVRRANPFAIGSEWLAMPKPPSRRPRDQEPQGTEVGPEVKGAIEDFFALREPAASNGRMQTRPRKLGRIVDDQESFVGQLG